MKKTLYLILACLFSCQKEKSPDPSLLPSPEENRSWIVYEGRVPLDEKHNLYMEVSLFPSGPVGEGLYRISEFTEDDQAYLPLSSIMGKYSTLYGETPEESILQFHNSARDEGLTRIYSAPGAKGSAHSRVIREEPFRTTDLTVKISGRNHLAVLDNNLKPVSTETQHTLIRRTSRPFTVEGYFRHNGDTANLLEMNTKENWAVSKRGDYRKAIRQYYQLTTRKFEVTYMKAIGFTVRHINKRGEETDALVIKNVLQMMSNPDTTHAPDDKRPNNPDL